jgi:fatty-acid desaturase
VAVPGFEPWWVAPIGLQAYLHLSKWIVHALMEYLAVASVQLQWRGRRPLPTIWFVAAFSVNDFGPRCGLQHYHRRIAASSIAPEEDLGAGEKVADLAHRRL